MEVRSNGTFYNPINEPFKKNAINIKNCENKVNHQENIPSNFRSNNLDDKLNESISKKLGNPGNLDKIDTSKKPKIQQNKEKMNIQECKIRKFVDIC